MSFTHVGISYEEWSKYLVVVIEEAERALGERKTGKARAILRRALDLNPDDLTLSETTVTA